MLGELFTAEHYQLVFFAIVEHCQMPCLFQGTSSQLCQTSRIARAEQ